MEGGCIYVNCRSIEDFTNFLQHLNDRIKLDSSDWTNINTHNKTKTDFESIASESDIFFNVLLKELTSRTEGRFVFLFDNVDELISNEKSTSGKQFIEFIEKII